MPDEEEYRKACLHSDFYGTHVENAFIHAVNHMMIWWYHTIYIRLKLGFLRFSRRWCVCFAAPSHGLGGRRGQAGKQGL